ncbi:hypothetical protein J4E85_001601 [Alternaria conjuncta]|uniref:uncharacterized protein n=1 Tax=Alternaria conjuncta TaxID=181017 RepID=UPI002220E496|nr:uncharacterized protein J4E85_001601 [Alternaria conjuncta]KAI4936272.1 hypothetical protein J4E85_001601 [Alternaria conjuncta]
MQLLQIINRSAFLALLSSPLYAHAQRSQNADGEELSPYNRNLTLRFFKDGHDDTCDYYNSRDALTFTTDSIPVVQHCFSLADLFGGNATQGFVNQTSNLGYIPFGEANAGIYWTILNAEKYDRSANYSRVLYRYHVANPADDRYEQGHLTSVWVTINGGEDCSEGDPNDDENLLDWFGYNCWGADEGNCGNTPYPINSFNIYPGDADNDRSCWLHSELGAAVHGFSSSRAIMGAFASVSLAVWLAL